MFRRNAIVGFISHKSRVYLGSPEEATNSNVICCILAKLLIETKTILEYERNLLFTGRKFLDIQHATFRHTWPRERRLSGTRIPSPPEIIFIMPIVDATAW